MKCKMLLIAAAVLALCSLSFGQSQLFGISDYGYQLTLGDGVTPVPDGTTIYVFRTPDAAVSCPGSDGSGDQQPRTFAEDGNIVDRVSYNQWPLNGAGSLGFDGTFDYADVGYIVSGGGSAFSSPATFYVVIPYGDGSHAWVSPAGTLSASALPQDFDYSTESDWQRSQNCWTFAPPVLGRCCYGDPSAPSCAVVPESQCQTLAGAWLANETCETAPCPVVTPVGRCCYGDPFAPSCAQTTANECAALGGGWLVGASCTSDPCPAQPRLGRCCYDNNTQCSYVTETACVALGGSWDVALTCDTPCPPSLGACCYNHGLDCAEGVTGIECEILGGTWYIGANCAELRASGLCVPPPTGRCCYGDPFAPSCSNTYDFECASLGGSWDGTTTCEASPCPVACQSDADITLPAIACPEYPCQQFSCVCFTVAPGDPVVICVGPVSGPTRIPVGHIEEGNCPQGPYAAGVSMGEWVWNEPYYCATVTSEQCGTVKFCLDWILPVSFTSFDAMPHDNAVTVTWATASESALDRFVVERAVAGHEFTAIGSVAANNSVSGSNYSFVDRTAQNGMTYTYRVAVMAVDGSRELNDMVDSATPSTTEGGLVNEYALLQNYPNPFNPTTAISFDVAQTNLVTLKVYNSAGQEVATLANGEFGAGRHTLTFDAKNITSGVYFYTVKIGSEFTATKKMLLMK